MMAAKRKTESKKAPTKVQKKPQVELPVVEEEAPIIVPEHRSRCGGALRTQREKRGWAVQEVASRLRLSAKQIEALEADNFDVLPEATIVRGFIRNYAKLLKISPEPVLDAYNVLMPSQAPHSLTVKPTADMSVARPNFGFRRLLPLLLALLFGLLIWWFYQAFVQSPNPTKPAVSSLPEPEPMPEAAMPAAERGDMTVTELQLPPTAEVATAAPAATNMPEEIPTARANEVAQTGDTTATAQANLTNPEKSRLEFSATQETWVSVTDTNGKEIFNRTLFEGNRETIDVTPPANITVGNASGTSLSVNGKVVDLAPHTRVNVAHVKVQ